MLRLAALHLPSPSREGRNHLAYLGAARLPRTRPHGYGHTACRRLINITGADVPGTAKEFYDG